MNSFFQDGVQHLWTDIGPSPECPYPFHIAHNWAGARNGLRITMVWGSTLGTGRLLTERWNAQSSRSEATVQHNYVVLAAC